MIALRPTTIALFTFNWDGIRRADYNSSDWFDSPDFHDNHTNFNNAFVRTFPRLLYTTPFTNYSNARIGVESRITGTGETNWNESQVRAAIIAGVNAVGLIGDTSRLQLSYLTLEQIQQGQNLEVIGNTNVNPLVTEDGAGEATKDFTIYFALGAVAVIALLMRGRK